MTDETLDEHSVERDPLKQFKVWFDSAVAAKLPLPEAMSLATVTREGKPTSRMVLLKSFDTDGFVFYTNYLSAKAKDLETNPNVALNFFWPQLEKQVRIEGTVAKTSADESRRYFEVRPRESQIGAWNLRL